MSHFKTRELNQMHKQVPTVNIVFYVENSCRRENFLESGFSTGSCRPRMLTGGDSVVTLASLLVIIRADERLGQDMIGEISEFDTALGAPPALRVPRLALISASFAASLLLLASAAFCQNTPINPPPGFGQVPEGTGACSVEKSCADLAPLMIQSALGPSPLEENLRTLTDSIGGRVTGSPAAGRAVTWAVEALRRAGVDEVRVEKFTVAAGWSEGQTRLEVLSPASFPVRLVSVGWSPPTPAGESPPTSWTSVRATKPVLRRSARR